jgi:hypothetical protein
MHGKPKAQYVYAEGQIDPMSEVHYFYKNNVSNGKQLDNTVYVINKDGSVSRSLSGLEYDFVHDMREQETKMFSGGVNLNLSGFIAGIFPALVPTLFPSWNQEHTRFRSTVITKVINRYGILERTEAHDAGSTVTTENLAWDAETGELLVTKTKNNFDDPIYNFSYPAHWGYDRMGQAYQNLMTCFPGTTITAGSATIASASDYFVPGDELSITDDNDVHRKAWVCSVSGSTLNIIDSVGAPLVIADNPCSILITRSGRRNQQALAIGGVTLLRCPLVDNTGSDGIYDAIDYDRVINAQAQEFDERWQLANGSMTPAYATCSCQKSSRYGWLAQFVMQLQLDGDLLSSGELVYDHSTVTYYHGFNGSLRQPPLSMTSNIYWYPTVSGQVMTGVVKNPSAGGSYSITLELPAGYSFNQIGTMALGYFMEHPGDCDNGTSYDFTANCTMLNGDEIVASGTNTLITMDTLCGNGTPPVYCGKKIGDTINPYFENVLGVWRPLRSHLYLAARHQATASNNTDIRKDGYFLTKDHTTGASIDYQPFWLPNSGNDWTKDNTYWTWSSEVTKYTPYGNEVENRDALSRYSAAVFGYNHSLPIAVASNAQYQEIAFDGFEDYAFIDSTNCSPLHFNFYDDRANRRSTYAHTGLYSMMVAQQDTLYAERTLSSVQGLSQAAACVYILSSRDMLNTFSPITYLGDKEYVLNYWVRETGGTPPVFNYSNAAVKISFVNGSGIPSYPSLTLVQKSDIIEGWQQYQYTFTIPASQSGSINVMLCNSGTGTTAYFDDIRLHPFNSNMKSYVYHPVNLRFTSELDENNYATFYEYDEEGALIRVKKETAKGIMTIKESRNNSSH